MSDPRRLLEDPSELLDEERELLRAGQQLEPPEALSRALWSSLASKLSLAALAPESAVKIAQPQARASVAGKLGSSIGLVKGALIVGAIGVAGFFGSRLVRGKNEPAPRAPAPLIAASDVAPAPASASAPLAQTASSAPAPSANEKPITAIARPTTIAHSAKAPAEAPAPAASSDAREESRAVAAARDALRSGNAANALALLEQARQRFGAGVLGQERAALTIEALAKSGQTAAAHTRGEAFLKTYANSPYAAKVRQIIGDPAE